MNSLDGNLIDTDVLVIGGGAGGLMAALSAKRHGPPGTRVTLVNSWLIGRTGHTAFSNAWTIVALPGDDIDGILHEIVAGNDGIADQELVRQSLIDSHARLKDFEAMGMHFGRDEEGRYKRRPTRGLDLARVMYPEGGGLEFAWKLRLALEREGVQLIDRLFITGLMRGGGDRIIGAVGINSRTGEFNVIKARATIVATNAITFRSGFVRDITGTGTLLAYRAGAALRNAEFSYVRPGTPKFYFEGITFAIQEGARWVNAKGEAFMARLRAGVGRRGRRAAHRARHGDGKPQGQHAALSRHVGDPRAPARLLHPEQGAMDGQFLPQARRRSQDRHVRQDAVLRAQPDDQDGHPHRRGLPLRRAGAACRRGSRRPAAPTISRASTSGFASATAGSPAQSAIEDLDRLPAPALDAAEVRALHAETHAPLNDEGEGGVRPHPARPAGA